MAFNLALFSANGDEDPSLVQALDAEGLAFVGVSHPNELSDMFDATLMDLSAGITSEVSIVAERCKELSIPLICTITEDSLPQFSPLLGATDFLVLPPRKGEIAARVRQVTSQDREESTGDVLHIGDLRIDLQRYEVFNRDRRVQLTFKEYKLLCLLASSPGRVFTRENLLSQIWEYDYYGGTRTVDVHIRRLRSKVEDPGQNYIETVWNVGYRFRIK